MNALQIELLRSAAMTMHVCLQIAKRVSAQERQAIDDGDTVDAERDEKADTLNAICDEGEALIADLLHLIGIEPPATEQPATDHPDEEEPEDACTNPGGHEFPRDIDERERCLCIHCGADGDA